MGMGPSSSSILLLPLLILLLHPAASSGRSDASATVAAICCQVPNPKLCTSAFHLGKAPLDQRAALEHLLHALRTDIKAATKKARALPDNIKNQKAGGKLTFDNDDNDASSSPYPVRDCIAGLKAAAENLREGVGYFKMDDGDSLRSSLSAIDDDYGVCVGKKTVMQKDVEGLAQSVDNCLALVNVIWPAQSLFD